jgi:hypothetical protein
MTRVRCIEAKGDGGRVDDATTDASRRDMLHVFAEVWDLYLTGR